MSRNREAEELIMDGSAKLQRARRVTTDAWLRREIERIDSDIDQVLFMISTNRRRTG